MKTRRDEFHEFTRSGRAATKEDLTGDSGERGGGTTKHTKNTKRTPDKRRRREQENLCQKNNNFQDSSYEAEEFTGDGGAKGSS
jgi:hypothetical protein